MGRKAAELTDMAVRRLNEPGLYFVGGVSGLALQVLPTGGRTWILRATIGNRRRDMGLGGYPDVTLASARESARRAREKIREGIDPIEDTRRAKSALIAAAARVLTFKDAALAYIAAHEKSWKNPKHRQQWGNTLETYAYPVIGKLSVADVQLAHVLQILEPIWTEKTETANRLRGRIETVLDWATVRGHREGLNPARWKGHLDAQLPKPSRVRQVRHHPALPIDRGAAFIAELRQRDGTGARALEFAILTVTRSNEARGARWPEIDLQSRVWKIPGGRRGRMKGESPPDHRVPLSQAAVELLESLPRLAETDLVFPSSRGGELSDATLEAVIERMNGQAPQWIDPAGEAVVPHGFRSTFRDWAAERTAYPHEMAEMALAHTVGNKVEAAYRRGDMFEKRRRMMDDWADFLEAPHATADVVSIGQRRTK